VLSTTQPSHQLSNAKSSLLKDGANIKY